MNHPLHDLQERGTEANAVQVQQDPAGSLRVSLGFLSSSPKSGGLKGVDASACQSRRRSQ